MLTQVVDVFRYPVGQVPVLRLRPHELHGVKFRCVRRQPARLEPRASSALELRGSGSVGIQPIPNEQRRSPQAVVQGSKKSHHVNRVTVMVQDFVVQAETLRPWGDRHCTDHAQAVVSIPGIADGSLPDGSPGLAPQRLQKEAAFIEKNDASFSLGPLFLAGAIHPGATARWRPRHVLSRGVRASERSSRIGGEASQRNRHDSLLQTAARSSLAPGDSSTQESGSPTDLRRVPTRPAGADGRRALTAAGGRYADFSSKPFHRLAQAPFSTALRTRH
jgi:hypothetical protein